MILRASLLVVCLVFGFTNLKCLAQQGSDSAVSPAEYAVYSAALKQRYGSDGVTLFVIEDHTDKSSLNDHDDVASHFRYVKKHLPTLSQVAINDYLSKNKASQPLNESFSRKIKFTLISRDKFESYAGPGDMEMSRVGWETFYREYPESSGFLSLSHVGFDRRRGQALVWIYHMRGNPSGRAWGDGSYLLLVKKKGVWRVRGMVAVMVS